MINKLKGKYNSNRLTDYAITETQSRTSIKKYYCFILDNFSFSYCIFAMWLFQAAQCRTGKRRARTRKPQTTTLKQNN